MGRLRPAQRVAPESTPRPLPETRRSVRAEACYYYLIALLLLLLLTREIAARTDGSAVLWAQGLGQDGRVPAPGPPAGAVSTAKETSSGPGGAHRQRLQRLRPHPEGPQHRAPRQRGDGEPHPRAPPRQEGWEGSGAGSQLPVRSRAWSRFWPGGLAWARLGAVGAARCIVGWGAAPWPLPHPAVTP